MWWRLPHAQWQAQKGQANRQTLCELVTSGTVPGLIAYRGSIPVGWCAVAPRADFPRLATSRILKPVDEERVWSIPCLFVDRAHRRTGVSKALLVAAREFAAKRGARVVEGYPVDTGGRRKPDVFVFTGLFEAFQAAGFAEVARRSAFRPVVRWYK
jgi:GNAT superfamily N-acetyltransferase